MLCIVAGPFRCTVDAVGDKFVTAYGAGLNQASSGKETSFTVVGGTHCSHCFFGLLSKNSIRVMVMVKGTIPVKLYLQDTRGECDFWLEACPRSRVYHATCRPAVQYATSVLLLPQLLDGHFERLILHLGRVSCKICLVLSGCHRPNFRKQRCCL